MNKLKHIIVKYLTRNLLVALTDEDIIRMTSRGWFLKGKKLSQEDVAFLRDEAREFKDSLLWKAIRNEIRFEANTRMFEQGAIEGNTLFGRAMLYNLDLIEKYLDNCRKL